MSRAQFDIAFDGEAFDDGEIDVRDLAPALLALGKVVQAANSALNGDRANATLKVKATAEGSFVATLAMEVSWIVDMLDAVAARPDRVVAANQLMELLMKSGAVVGSGIGGLFWILKKLRGRRPDRVERLDGSTIIEIDGSQFTIDDRTYELLRDLPTREAVESFGQKMARISGLREVRMGSGTADEEAIVYDAAELEALKVPEETDAPETMTTHSEVWLKIVSVHFRDGYKWRFTDGGEKPFTAIMEDTEFQNSVHDGRIAINANDTVLCRLREDQTLSGGSLTKEVFVEEVLQFRPGPRQLSLV